MGKLHTKMPELMAKHNGASLDNEISIVKSRALCDKCHYLHQFMIIFHTKIFAFCTQQVMYFVHCVRSQVLIGMGVVMKDDGNEQRNEKKIEICLWLV